MEIIKNQIIAIDKSMNKFFLKKLKKWRKITENETFFSVIT